MSTRTWRALPLAGVILMASLGAPPVLAQTESGPGAASRVEALKVVVVTGDDAGKEIDFAAQRKDRPTLFAFVQADKWDRPMARFLRTLDRDLGKERRNVHMVAVWLTDDDHVDVPSLF